MIGQWDSAARIQFEITKEGGGSHSLQRQALRCCLFPFLRQLFHGGADVFRLYISQLLQATSSRGGCIMMFSEKRGGAPSWSALTRQSLPLESAADSQHQTCSTPAAVRRKWHPCGQEVTAAGGPPDGSLTSLGWLQNLKVLDLFSPEVRGALHPPSPCSEDGCSSWETLSTSSASPLGGKNDPLLSGGGSPPSPLHQCLAHSTQFRSAPKRYQSDSAKPPFSHSSLVYLAIQHSRSGKASLHEICRWIKTNFKFFKEAEPGWQVGVRKTKLWLKFCANCFPAGCYQTEPVAE